MYHQRFKSYQEKRIFHFSGRFSLVHLGGGSFLYTFPGKSRPVVGKIELTRKKYRFPGISLLLVLSLVSGLILFMSQAGSAGSLASASGVELSSMENLEGKDLSPEELEKQSEEVRSKILSSGEVKEKSRIKELKKSLLAKKRGIEIYRYKIKRGDNLSSISQKFGVAVDLIAASSGITPYAILRPGQVLQVPSKSGLIYTMKKGDTLAAVAQKYKVKLKEVVYENPELPDLDLIGPQTVVFLPNAKIPAPPSPWVRPAWGRLTSTFGWRRHPLFNRRQFHGGIDIAIYYRPVAAARDGKVIYAGYLGSYGNAVVIKHVGGYKTLYAHLSKVKVSSGSYIKAGNIIGISGNTGMSTGPHLHFEVIKNGKAVNPRKYVRF